MSDQSAKTAPAALPQTEGQVVTGTAFSEPMRVESMHENGPGTWVVGLCGVNTEKFRKVTLTDADIQQLHVQKPTFTYDGDGQVLGRHALLLGRRPTRRCEMERQRSLPLQAVDRLTSIIVLPHPDRDRPEMANLRPDPETEAVAMRVLTLSAINMASTDPRLYPDSRTRSGA